ncbi:hypothetical protein MPTK1_1g23890 [Marchantia polymorpha subsp. ruderalis]|uniref:Uncharacterized protein n=2 Tax=Marchantia polymorpha TaxID=3197 RepID=A0AAF6ATM6_MARPO|nr:hypothetical protein MARPO_0061s0131 [Marchantia polymorpha]BBM99796.1 hypothetical protein Mp_1g23890 [Marchantia polymorpha subsp. ruderalis]|eukprot:PTQ36888.1 hypothetical protein MARPO_0061s0131 [Marchantia polymorpha]
MREVRILLPSIYPATVSNELRRGLWNGHREHAVPDYGPELDINERLLARRKFGGQAVSAPLPSAGAPRGGFVALRAMVVSLGRSEPDS